MIVLYIYEPLIVYDYNTITDMDQTWIGGPTHEIK